MNMNAQLELISTTIDSYDTFEYTVYDVKNAFEFMKELAEMFDENGEPTTQPDELEGDLDIDISEDEVESAANPTLRSLAEDVSDEIPEDGSDEGDDEGDDEGADEGDAEGDDEGDEVEEVDTVAENIKILMDHYSLLREDFDDFDTMI